MNSGFHASSGGIARHEAEQYWAEARPFVVSRNVRHELRYPFRYNQVTERGGASDVRNQVSRLQVSVHRSAQSDSSCAVQVNNAGARSQKALLVSAVKQ